MDPSHNTNHNISQGNELASSVSSSFRQTQQHPQRQPSMIATGRSSPALPSASASASTLSSSFPLVDTGGATSQLLQSNNNKHIPAVMRKMEECDYDKAPTVLYKKIERKEWDEVLQLFADEEEDDKDEDGDDDNNNQEEALHLQAKPTTPTTTPNILKPRTTKQEASVWVVRKEPDGRLRWRLLPLHAALIFNAPLSIIEALLRVFPKGAALKDDQGMTALHLACRTLPTPNFCILEELLTSYPAAVYVKDRKGRTPLQAGLAANAGAASAGVVGATTTTANTNTSGTAASSSNNNSASSTSASTEASSSAAALSVMELYTQIAAAGEKQRWRTEHEQQTQQQMQLLQDQHQAQMAAVKQDYDAQLAALHKKLALNQGSLAAQLKATQLQYEMTLKQLQDTQKRDEQQQKQQEQHHRQEMQRQSQCNQQEDEEEGEAQQVRREPPLSSTRRTEEKDDNKATAQTDSAEVTQLRRTNQQLQSALHLLLEQQASLQDSWRTLQADQLVWHEERNALLRSYLNKSEQGLATSEAHTALWQEELAKTQATVAAQLQEVGLGYVVAAVTEEEETNRKTNHAEEKKTQDEQDHMDNIDNTENELSEQSSSSYRNPAAVILSKHGAEVLP